MTNEEPEDHDKHRDTINVNDPADVAYWAKRLTVSEQHIRAAVAKVGPLVRDVSLVLWRLI
jgi:hypothetical protein